MSLLSGKTQERLAFVMIWLNSAKCVKRLVDGGTDINAKNWLGESLVTYAIRIQRKEIICYLLDKGVHLDTQDCITLTPLSWAYVMAVNAKSKKQRDVSMAIFRNVLKNGANPNAPANPLSDAIRNQDLEIIRELVQAGANPYQMALDNIVPMELAREIGNLEILAILNTLKPNDPL